jgi:hypothetical protein
VTQQRPLVGRLFVGERVAAGEDAAELVAKEALAREARSERANATAK